VLYELELQKYVCLFVLLNIILCRLVTVMYHVIKVSLTNNYY